ncbi:hypothetical protein E1171_17035 [Cytophagales bacterium RKSG123]|nr:hypothetical protein [Xanthovirga aplysinae]
MLTIGFLVFFLIGCKPTNCPPNLNKQPMFGKAEKCPKQIKIDNDFLKQCDKIFEHRKIAAQYHIDQAWGFFYENKLDSSMMRFNQAWLLDSLNAEIFWGYGNLMGRKGEFQKSLVFFDKSIKLNPNNAKVWESASTSFGQLFFQTKDVELLNKSIEYLKRSVELDPTNARAFGQLSGAYTYFIQKDSARKYLEIAEALDPEAVNPEVRRLIMEK